MAFPSLRHVTAVLVTIGAILDPRFAAAQSSERSSSKLDSATSDRVKHGDEGRLQVIVRVRPGELTNVTSQLRQKGHAISHAHGLINALTVSIPIDEIEALSRQSSVLSVSVDAVVTADQSDSSYTLRSTLGLPAQSPAGNRIGVAVVDSGIEPGPEFGDRLVGFYDFTNGGRTAQPTDGYGHGTHVAGIIAGDGGLSQKRYRGVAPKARLTGFKVLDSNGTGLTSDVISAIEYATEHKDSLGIDIINLSLGHPIYEPAASDPLVQAVEAASRAGIVVVTSAGNYGINPATGLPGYAGVVSPANAPSAITVGAVKTSDTNTRRDDRVAPYSSRGPTWYDGMAKPDLVAPGHGIVSVAAHNSTLYVNNPGLRVGDNYLSLSGTSMAAGVVSGTVALVLEANRAHFPGRRG